MTGEELTHDEAGAAGGADPQDRVDEVIGAMYAGAEKTKRRELETALSKLDTHGSLTPEKREAVAALADALVEALLGPPAAGLRVAAARDDRDVVDAAIDLFDPSFAADERSSEFSDAGSSEMGQAADGDALD